MPSAPFPADLIRRACAEQLHVCARDDILRVRWLGRLLALAQAADEHRVPVTLTAEDIADIASGMAAASPAAPCRRSAGARPA